ncbi:MAG TPA: hypothetical protein DC048_05300 [Planctomycetaceae bacterium]|nr:hypothetical protein [Planctomycetaceae bacterium]
MSSFPATATPQPAASPQDDGIDATIALHVSHTFYRFRSRNPLQWSQQQRAQAEEVFCDILRPDHPDGPAALQTWYLRGGLADFGVFAKDSSPFAVEGIRHRLLASAIGELLEPVFAFASMTGPGEHLVPPREFARVLTDGGMATHSAEHTTALEDYTRTWTEIIADARDPRIPSGRNVFFSGIRVRDTQPSWHSLPLLERIEIMTQLMELGARSPENVSEQLTRGSGFADLDYGMTLWSARPEYLSAFITARKFSTFISKYATLGPCFAGIVQDASGILSQCRVLKAAH